MITAERFRELALSFEATSDAPHFDRTAFKTPRRTFVTLAADGRSANVCLTPELQELFVHSRPGQFAVIANGWGAQGWTTVDLDRVDEGSLTDALRAAHGLARPAAKKPAAKKAASKKTASREAAKSAPKTTATTTEKATAKKSGPATTP